MCWRIVRSHATVVSGCRPYVRTCAGRASSRRVRSRPLSRTITGKVGVDDRGDNWPRHGDVHLRRCVRKDAVADDELYAPSLRDSHHSVLVGTIFARFVPADVYMDTGAMCRRSVVRSSVRTSRYCEASMCSSSVCNGGDRARQ
jgi:hypothetical protein